MWFPLLDRITHGRIYTKCNAYWSSVSLISFSFIRISQWMNIASNGMIIWVPSVWFPSLMEYHTDRTKGNGQSNFGYKCTNTYTIDKARMYRDRHYICQNCIFCPCTYPSGSELMELECTKTDIYHTCNVCPCTNPDQDGITNGRTEFYKCTNGMYRGQTLQGHYKVKNLVWDTNLIGTL